MSICLASAGVVKSFALASFMLSWVHSVEKVEWQEDWRVTPQGLEIVEARVKGSGAGMEPPPDARLVDGWFRWTPKQLKLNEVALGNSGIAGEWKMCAQGKCRELSDIIGQPAGVNVVTLSVCKGPQPVPDALDVNGLLARGNAFRDKGERRRALADYDAALRLDPQHEPTKAARKSLFQDIERLGATMPLKQSGQK